MDVNTFNVCFGYLVFLECLMIFLLYRLCRDGDVMLCNTVVISPNVCVWACTCTLSLGGMRMCWWVCNIF